MIKQLLKSFRISKFSWILLALSGITLFLHLFFHDVRVLGKNESIFYLDEASTTAAYLTSVIAVFTGLLFFVYSSVTPGKVVKRINLLVGAFFVFFSLDEYFDLHENLNIFIRGFIPQLAELDAMYSFSWIIALLGLVIVAIYVLALLIVKETQPNAKVSYILGLLCFVIVLFLEIIGSNYYGLDIYIPLIGIEETLEVIGITMFLNGITSKLRFTESKN